MNNEEKILTMLVSMQTSLEKMRVSQEELRASQEELRASQEELRVSQEEMRTSFEKRFQTIEDRLEELDDRSLRSAVMLENEVGPKVQLLYEGQAALREKVDTLAPKAQVDALDADMSVVKDVVKLMRQEINKSKKAQ